MESVKKVAPHILPSVCNVKILISGNYRENGHIHVARGTGCS